MTAGEPTPPTACVLIIGNEILSGRTVDANLSYLAAQLNDLGIAVTEARVVRDDRRAIVSAINELRQHCSYVFCTGGIGPTHDDITTECVAAAFGVPVRRHPQAEAILRDHYSAAELNAARLKMADIPEGASLIDNPVSRAPGFQIDNVFVLPGVPRILQAMFDGLRGRLRGGDPVLSRTIAAFAKEGTIAAGLASIQLANPNVEIGSYPFVRGDRIGVSLVARTTDPIALHRVGDEIATFIRSLGTELIDDATTMKAPK